MKVTKYGKLNDSALIKVSTVILKYLELIDLVIMFSL